jgi:Na+-exporting ATPase
MTASDFDELSDDQVDELPVLPLVVARCAPSTKVRMIEALHRRGRFCAMVFYHSPTPFYHCKNC